MALLIPENLRTRPGVPQATRRVVSALQSALGDRATIWYEPPFDLERQRPHLVVLDPDIGVAVLEIATVDRTSRLVGWDGSRQRFQVDGVDALVADPLSRAERLASAVRTELRGRGAVAVPVGAVGVLPYEERAWVAALVGGDLDVERCICADELRAALQTHDPGPLRARFVHAVGGPPLTPLDEAQQSGVRAIIHPDVLIGSSVQGALFSASELDETDVIKVMDREQEQLAKSLGSGHRVVRGVAGSGKTLLVVHRARVMSRLMPGRRILVTCFTKALASQLQAQLAGLPNVEVRNLHALMYRALTKAGAELPTGSDRFDRLPAIALEALRSTGTTRYEAVMVDEAQDFDTDALRFCVELLSATDPDEQDLVIVADSAQNIFRRNFTWKDAGINAQGRTRVLRVNYRNTKEILAVAHAFLMAAGDVEVDGPSAGDEVTVVPPEAGRRSGPAPELLIARNGQDEINQVVRIIAALIEQQRGSGQSPASRSIAVLYAGHVPRRAWQPAALVRELRLRGADVFWVTDPANPHHKDRAGSASEPVIVSTIESAKGLEYPAVVVCGLGLGDDGDELAARKRAYVGMTRAVEDLAVVVTARNRFRADLETAFACVTPNGSADEGDAVVQRSVRPLG